MSDRVHIVHFHGKTREGLERAISAGEDLELGEIAVITGEEEKVDE